MLFCSISSSDMLLMSISELFTSALTFECFSMSLLRIWWLCTFNERELLTSVYSCLQLNEKFHTFCRNRLFDCTSLVLCFHVRACFIKVQRLKIYNLIRDAASQSASTHTDKHTPTHAFKMRPQWTSTHCRHLYMCLTYIHTTPYKSVWIYRVLKIITPSVNSSTELQQIIFWQSVYK